MVQRILGLLEYFLSHAGLQCQIELIPLIYFHFAPSHLPLEGELGRHHTNQHLAGEKDEIRQCFVNRGLHIVQQLNLPMLSKEYKISLIVKRDNSSPLELRIVRE